MRLAGREKMTHTTRREKKTRAKKERDCMRACDVYRGFFVVIFGILFLESHQVKTLIIRVTFGLIMSKTTSEK